MSIDENFEQLWLRQQTMPPPSERELISKAINLKRRASNKLLLSLIILVLTVGFIICIVWIYKPRYITTYFGTILVISAICMQVLVSAGMLSFLFREEPAYDDASKYLDLLIRLRSRQQFLQIRLLSVYSVVLLAGILLYMIEYTQKMAPVAKALAYGLTIGWFAIVWFYLRPRTVRREAARLDAVIGQLEKLKEQLQG